MAVGRQEGEELHLFRMELPGRTERLDKGRCEGGSTGPRRIGRRRMTEIRDRWSLHHTSVADFTDVIKHARAKLYRRVLRGCNSEKPVRARLITSQPSGYWLRDEGGSAHV